MIVTIYNLYRKIDPTVNPEHLKKLLHIFSLFISLCSIQAYAQINNVTFTLVASPCSGDQLGTATPIIAGTFTGPLTYLWSNGQTSQTATGLSGGGSYSLTNIHDAGTGQDFGPTNFNAAFDPFPLTVTATTPSTCFGLSTGTSTASGQAGTGPYSFLWGGIQTTTTLSGLGAGTISLKVTDAHNCTATTTVTTTVNALPTVTISGSPTICSGNSTVLLANSTATGSTFIWSPSTSLDQTTGSSVTANPIINTTYSITATSDKGCIGPATTQTITVNNVPNVTLTPSSIVICSGTSTNLAAGGDAVSYSWSPSSGLNATTGSTVTATPGSNTTYTVTGTNTCGNTTKTSAITLVASPTLTVSPLTSICIGSFTTLTVGNATTYTWMPSASLNQTTGNSVNANPTITSTYTITGTTGVCTGTATVTVGVNPIPTVTAIAGSNTICTGSSTSITASGGTTYTWSPTTGLSQTTGAIVNANPTVNTTYTIVGTSLGCSGSGNVTININPLPTLSLTGNSTVCSGSPATLTAAGATTFTWSPATSLSTSTGSSVIASPTTATTYTVTGALATGCSSNKNVTITTTSLPTLTSSANITICPGTSTSLSAGGANTYTWSPATGLNVSTGGNVTASVASTTTYTVTGNITGGCSNTAIITVTLKSAPTLTISPGTNICVGGTTTLTVGGAVNFTWSPSTALNVSTGSTVIANPGTTKVYTATGTDAVGCTNTASSTVTVIATPTVVLSPNTTICTGFPATLTAGGAISFTWTPATGLSATNTASVNANPSVFTTYTVVGSTSGCSSNSTTVSVDAASAIITNAGSDVPICSGGSSPLNATNGATYTWSPGSGLSCTNCQNPNASPTVTTTYTVTATSGSCVDQDDITVTVNAVPTVTVSGNTTYCAGTPVNLLAGGSGANTFTWSPSTFLSGTVGASVNSTPTTSITYTVTGTNTATGCNNRANSTITVHSLPIVTISANTSICPGTSQRLTAGGGTNFTWSPSASLDQATGTAVIASPTLTQTYTVTVTDANTCTNTNTTTVTLYTPPTVTTSINTSICTGNSSSLSATGAGGTNFTWSPGTTLNTTSGINVIASPTNVGDNIYTVTGTDGHTCTNTAAITVTVFSLPAMSKSANATICSENSAIISAFGATITSYVWSPSGSLSASTGFIVSAGPSASITYNVIGTDANGCSRSRFIDVFVNPLPTLTTSSNATICAGAQTGLTVGGAGINGTYTWAPSGSLSAPTGASIVAGPATTTTYSVTGTDASTCSNISTVTVFVTDLPTLTVSSNKIICEGDLSTLTVGGSGGATYTWSPASNLNTSTGSSVIATPTATTTYSVTGDNGVCSKTSSLTVTVNALPTVSFSGLTSYCSNSPDVTVIIGNHDGDTPPGAFVPSNTYMVGNIFKPSVAGNGTFTIKYGYTDPLTTCTDTASYTTTVGASLAVSLSPSGSLTFCAGDSVVLDAGAYSSYSWSTGATTQTISVNTPVSGDYNINLTVTQGGSCTGFLASDSIVTVNAVPTLTVTLNLTACAGSSSLLDANGGSSYLWTPSTALNITVGKTVSASPTSTTTYTVTGSDGTCSSIDSVKVTVIALPTVSFSGLASSYCSNPGDITLIGNHSADLPPGAFLQTANVTDNKFNPGLSNGAFTVKYGYTSPSGCTDTASVSTLVSPTLAVTITPIGATTFCQGGTVVLSPGAYTNYLWSNGATTPSINVNSTGSYTVTVDNGTICSGFSEISVNVNPLPVVSFGGLAESYCNVLPTATLVPNPLGGTFSGLGITGSIFDPTNPGITLNTPFPVKYVYTDANACKDSVTKTVVVDTQLHPSISPSPSASFCQGNSIILDAGSYPDYTFNWSTSAITQTISTSSASTISVTISNGAGCFGSSAAFTPTVNALPTVTFSGLAPSYCASSGDVTLTGTPSGGTFSATAGITGNSFSPSGVPVGSPYDITYTSLADVNGCVGSSTQTTIVNTNLSPTITVTGQTTFCAGGSVNLNSNSGFDTYSWSNSSTTQAIDAQLTGDYNVTVTLGNNCLGFSPSTHITVNSNPIVSIDNLASTYCPGSPLANLILSPSGVGGVLSGNGINALTNTFDPSDASITLGISFPVKYVFTNNPGGCKDSVIQNVTVNSILAATINTIGNATFCDKDSVILDAGAGYTNYTWSPGNQTTSQITVKTQNTYSVTVENGSPSCSAIASKTITVNPIPTVSFDTLFSNYCTSSPPSILTGVGNPTGGTGSFFGTGISGNTFTPSITGTYTISYSYTITATGCSDVASQVTEVGLNISPSISPAGSITLCQGNTATLDPGLYKTYLWSTGATTQTINVPAITAIPEVTVTNGTGCSGKAIKIITGNTSPTITVLSDNATICKGASTNLTAGGSSISYQWAPSIGLNNSTGTALTANPDSPTTYSVTGTDINNCSNTATIDIAVNTLPTVPVISANGATTFCAGDSITVDAGSGYVTYLWLPGGETTQSISAKISATYSVQGFNSNNCAASSSIDITVNPGPTVIVSPNATVCLGGSTVLTADGGGTYSWTPVSGLSSATDATVTSAPIAPTSYTLTVTNAVNGCQKIKTVDVFVSTIALSSSITKPSLCSSTNGAIDLTVGSGISPYNFSWSNAATTEDLSAIGGGVFTVTVFDNALCQGIITVTVTPITPVSAKAGNDTVICKENTFMLNSNNSTGADNFQWFKVPGLTTIGTDSTLTIIPDAGISTFVLKAISGTCSGVDTIIVTSNPISVDAGSNVTFYAGNSAGIGGNPTTSVTGTTIKWMPHFGLSDTTAANPIASPTITTTYYVTVTNSGNCSVTDSVLFEIIPEVISTGGLSPNGDGLNDSWVIENIELYPNCLVEIYNRWGELLFSSPGYLNKWDATFNGKKLPVGTYYYIINLNDPVFPKPLTGPITILR